MIDAPRDGWSAAFAPPGPPAISPALPFAEITPGWAWGGSDGRGINVAIVDSGIDPAHPAVRGPVAGHVSISEDRGALVYDTAPHRDDHGHGTACAGIIRSLAPACDLYSVKVLGRGLTGRGVAFAAGLRWAIENGMRVCNLSLGTTHRDFYGVLHELADLAYFRNVVLVTAANNLPLPSFPSVYASVISVAAHDGQDPYRFYYNPSPPVEFGAPGVDVRIAWLDGVWLTGTGNSYAAPHIAGLVAKILAKHPGLTPFEVKTILKAQAANVSRGTTPAPPSEDRPATSDSPVVARRSAGLPR
jgi:subtilisin family serine protease